MAAGVGVCRAEGVHRGEQFRELKLWTLIGLRRIQIIKDFFFLGGKGGKGRWGQGEGGRQGRCTGQAEGWAGESEQ